MAPSATPTVALLHNPDRQTGRPCRNPASDRDTGLIFRVQKSHPYVIIFYAANFGQWRDAKLATDEPPSLRLPKFWQRKFLRSVDSCTPGMTDSLNAVVVIRPKGVICRSYLSAHFIYP
ncbi:hypothetical protein KL934_002278 [Ogataea polymorpha]|nr:hypothetical protein KL934_002278 [Ogataea polymorpha]